MIELDGAAEVHDWKAVVRVPDHEMTPEPSRQTLVSPDRSQVMERILIDDFCMLAQP
jgi:hypothetical protein